MKFQVSERNKLYILSEIKKCEEEKKICLFFTFIRKNENTDVILLRVSTSLNIF